MYNTARTWARPPWIYLCPRRAPLSSAKGASPTNTISVLRLSAPSSGKRPSSMALAIGPTPGTLATIAFIANKNLVKTMPRTWDDLLKGNYKGAAHAHRSRQAPFAVMGLRMGIWCMKPLDAKRHA